MHSSHILVTTGIIISDYKFKAKYFMRISHNVSTNLRNISKIIGQVYQERKNVLKQIHEHPEAYLQFPKVKLKSLKISAHSDAS